MFLPHGIRKPLPFTPVGASGRTSRSRRRTPRRLVPSAAAATPRAASDDGKAAAAAVKVDRTEVAAAAAAAAPSSSRASGARTSRVAEELHIFCQESARRTVNGAVLPGSYLNAPMRGFTTANLKALLQKCAAESSRGAGVAASADAPNVASQILLIPGDEWQEGDPSLASTLYGGRATSALHRLMANPHATAAHLHVFAEHFELNAPRVNVGVALVRPRCMSLSPRREPSSTSGRSRSPLPPSSSSSSSQPALVDVESSPPSSPHYRALRAHCIALCSALRSSPARAARAARRQPLRQRMRAAPAVSRRHRALASSTSRAARREQSSASLQRSALAAEHYCALLRRVHAPEGSNDDGEFRRQLCERFIAIGVCRGGSAAWETDDDGGERLVAAVVNEIGEHCMRSWERRNPTMKKTGGVLTSAASVGASVAAQAPPAGPVWVRITRRSAHELKLLKRSAAACECTRCTASRSKWGVMPYSSSYAQKQNQAMSAASDSDSDSGSDSAAVAAVATTTTRRPYCRVVTKVRLGDVGADSEGAAPRQVDTSSSSSSSFSSSSSAKSISELKAMFQEVLVLLDDSVAWKAVARVRSCHYRALRSALRLSDLRSRAECLFVLARERAFITADGEYDAERSAPYHDVCSLLERARCCLVEGQELFVDSKKT